MKKIVAFLLFSFLIISFVFAVTDEYIEGYNQGYADALAGVANIYEKQSLLDSEDMGIWTIRYFVDDFGDYTNDAYIITEKKGSGTFSNSATQKSDLRWQILVDDWGQAFFFLYEYGNSQVTGSSSYPTEYTISVKLIDGTVKTFSATNSYDRLEIDYKDMLEFLDILLEGEPFKMTIKEKSSYYSSSYNLGTIEPEGFSNAFSKAFPDYDRSYVELLIKLM